MKDFKNYIQKVVQEAEKNDCELSRVAEALYILSDYMEEAGDSQIDCIDGRMMTRIFNDIIEVFDNHTGVRLASLHLNLEMDDRETYVWTDEDEVDLVSIGRHVWSTFSAEKRDNFALMGTYGFIEELCAMLRLPITDSFEQFDRIHNRILGIN